MSKSNLYRYTDLDEIAKDRALGEVLNRHTFDQDYALDKQIGAAEWSKEEFYKFLLESNDDTYWFKKNGKIALRTNPLIQDGVEFSSENLSDDEETGVVNHYNANEYALVYGYKSWKELERDFKEQKKIFGLKGKIQVKKAGDGFTLTVCQNFAKMYWEIRV